MSSPFPCCPVNRECSLKKTQIEKIYIHKGYLPLIQKGSSTHVHGLAVYVKEGLPFARDLSLENSADS